MSRLAHYLQNLQRFGIRPGLERIEALLESAGNPQLQYPVLLVGGTNGKGSTCEFAARLLASSGRRIGLFTSPHLYEWNERIRILPGGGLFEGSITDTDLDALFDNALPHIKAVAAAMGQPTEFEVVTFLGFWHFARQNVDAAVIEVGLGGHWDATNVSQPLVSAVTHVALDHCDRLGYTHEEIAADKVHIARPGRPFLTTETKENVLAVFRDYCDRIGALLEVVAVGNETDFQHKNRALAKILVQRLAQQAGWDGANFAIETEKTGTVPGRAEVISQHPRVMIDGANNPDGAQILANQLTEFFQIPRDHLILVLGILADKDYAAMTEILAPLAKKIVVTQSDSPRAATTAQVATVARKYSEDVEEITPVGAAVERAKALANHDDTVVVTGSFTTIAEVPRP